MSPESRIDLRFHAKYHLQMSDWRWRGVIGEGARGGWGWGGGEEGGEKKGGQGADRRTHMEEIIDGTFKLYTKLMQMVQGTHFAH